jgi:hypothetical protein
MMMVGEKFTSPAAVTRCLPIGENSLEKLLNSHKVDVSANMPDRCPAPNHETVG